MSYDHCEYCKGQVREQKVRVDHRWKGSLTVVEKVPVGVCDHCGERYYDASVLHRLDLIAKGKVGSVRHIKVPVADYSQAVAA
ncbi:MAG: type II toxin-antitoxin system MqsA family antitoxin [Elusimicrobia bacterium]|nr:type II toxin-antitoxin system MqsA family antitoxin [Elusimicrobiota bacterium]